MIKGKIVAAVLSALSILTMSIQPISFAQSADVITIAGKAATSVEVTYDGEYYRNDKALPYLHWGPDASINDTVMHVSSPAALDASKYSDDKILIGYKFNVDSDGVYQLDISGSDVTHMYLCSYLVSMDGAEFKSVSAATAEVTDNPDYSLLKNYKTPLKYYLTAGAHEFKIQIRDLPGAAAKKTYDFYINNIVLNKTNDSEAADIFIYGLDNYSSKSEGMTAVRDSVEPANEGTQTGSAVRLNTPSNVFDEAGYVISYPFTVTEGGAYRLTDFGGSRQDVGYLAKYEISIDNAPYTKITDMKVSESAYDFKAVHMRKMQLNKRYSLEAGTHYFNIHVYEKREQGNVHAYFDYIKLTHETEQEGFSVYGIDDSVNNIASFTGGYEQTKLWLINDAGKNPTSNELNSRKMISIDGQKATGDFPKDGITLDYPFYCDKDGWYSLDLIMDNKGTWFSPIELAVDGKNTVAFNNPTTHIVTSERIDGNTNKYDTDLSYFITKGMHTLNYKVTGVAPDRKWVLSFFTEASFTPISEKDLATDVRIKAKDDKSFVENGVEIAIDATEESGSSTAIRFRSSADDFKAKGYMDIIYPFNIYVSGTYDIKTIAAGNVNNQWLSSYTIGIDGELLDVKSGITAEDNYAGALMRKYDTNLTCELTAGIHYLTFRILTERPAGGAYTFFDYVDLQLQEKPVLSLEVVGDYIEKGETTFVSLTAVNPRTGEVVNPNYESVVFQSSDTSVAVIEDNLVTAVGPGKADITATVTYSDGEQETVSAPAKVTVNSLYCETEGFTLDGNSVGAKVKIYNNDLFEGKAAVVFAAYADGKLKGIEIIANDSLEGLVETTFEPVLTGVNADEINELSVIIWNDINDLTPIAKKVSQ